MYVLVVVWHMINGDWLVRPGGHPNWPSLPLASIILSKPECVFFWKLCIHPFVSPTTSFFSYINNSNQTNASSITIVKEEEAQTTSKEKSKPPLHCSYSTFSFISFSLLNTSTSRERESIYIYSVIYSFINPQIQLVCGVYRLHLSWRFKISVVVNFT